MLSCLYLIHTWLGGVGGGAQEGGRVGGGTQLFQGLYAQMGGGGGVKMSET